MNLERKKNKNRKREKGKEYSNRRLGISSYNLTYDVVRRAWTTRVVDVISTSMVEAFTTRVEIVMDSRSRQNG